MDYFTWFDPHEARRIAADCPRKTMEASSAGYAAGQRDLQRILSSQAFKAMELAAETLGRQMAHHENVREAISTVAEGMTKNTTFDVQQHDYPDRRMEKVVQLVADVRPFRLSYGIRLEPADLYSRAY